LKRRLGKTTQAQPAPPPSQLFGTVERSTQEEPPHKKFKALFEESDPNRVGQTPSQADLPMSESLTQAETQGVTTQGRRSKASLVAVPEEEEESVAGVSVPPETQGRSQGVKRKAREVDDGDVEMGDEEAAARPVKRRAGREGVVQSQAAPEGTQATTGMNNAPSSRAFTNASSGTSGTQKSASAGAAPGKPDKDEAFLKAVASTKRGKKHEDEFDREFNNLRISKPDLQREEAAREWAVLDDFGDDGGVRGNFMVVVEMEVFRKDRARENVVRAGGERMDWEGRPDFKKFKKAGVFLLLRRRFLNYVS
jgi:hypothetical protein